MNQACNHGHLSNMVMWKHFFFLFRATPPAYGSSQARGRVGAAAASLLHSHSNLDPSCICYVHHSNTGSLTHWVRDGTYILMDTSWIHNPLSHNGKSPKHFFFFDNMRSPVLKYKCLLYFFISLGNTYQVPIMFNTENFLGVSKIRQNYGFSWSLWLGDG